MFSLTILGSGSAGNCALVQADGCRLLVDGGLSARQIVTRLDNLGIDPATLDGILVTHEHCDHIGGLEVFSKKYDVPVYCNGLTAETMKRGGMAKKEFRIFATGSDFSIRDVTVQTFPVPHDAVDPVGFVLHHGGGTLGFLTDLGHATKLVYERVRQVQTLVIETNHDEKMLQEDTRRPWAVKQRIMSRHGHLSNAAAANVVGELLGNGLERVILGHLSRDCNSPEVALATVRSKLAEMGDDTVEVHCASQKVISDCYNIRRETFLLEG
ncbi:MAG: MBL fold metallo-hydrolase [Chthoniobacteraceae bacterium]